MTRLDRFFLLSERGTTVSTEVRAGTTTFLTMAYILFVNPQILGAAGMPAEDVLVATALASALASLAMGLLANYPFALAPGMGLNAYFTFGVVQGLGVSWQAALTAVFVEGLIFLVLATGGVRRAVLSAIPAPLKLATAVGLGLFLALIGLQGAGLVVAHPATLVTLGDVRAPMAALALGGVLLTGVLVARRVPGALLLGIAGVAGAAWSLALAPLPEAVFRLPHLPRETLAAFDLGTLLSGKLWGVVLALLFVDLFDTAGTLAGVGRAAGFLDAQGELPRANRAFLADALGTVAGAVLGTSTVTSYVESAAGVEEGGRTGLTAVVVALLFLLALFLTPLLAAVPAVATAPALVVVGAFMAAQLRDLDLSRFEEALPAFLTLALIPFTYSIATGLAFGIVSYAVLMPLRGRGREVSPLLYGLAVVLVLYYATVRAA